MEALKINVNKQLDGYAFSIGPSVRKKLKSWFPNAYPANSLFLSYDIKSDFNLPFDKFEVNIFPVLFGVGDQKELKKKVDEILFVDSQTGHVLHKHKMAA
jgi:hypothetical protein